MRSVRSYHHLVIVVILVATRRLHGDNLVSAHVFIASHCITASRCRMTVWRLASLMECDGMVTGSDIDDDLVRQDEV